eukprot:TRINITY_DN26352_c0_g1_i1.p1 TRINITY_DN26352_c0_g1~~TRINITY_DN26352_c0_g1_i1.p1  ORF type:complete len:397 (+),score=32.39 TRINITY_DN26352_c0_g1_i1:54-1244(+)
MTNAVQWLILSGRGMRAFALGIQIVALPLALDESGLSKWECSAVLSAGLVGTMFQMQFVGALSRRYGRIATLSMYNLALSVAVGLVAYCQRFSLIVAAVFLGAFSTQPNISVQAPIEQATLAEHACGDERTHAFAWYNGISTIALAAGTFVTALPIEIGVRLQIMFSCILLVCATVACYFVSAKVDVVGKSPLLDKSNDLRLVDCHNFKRILSIGALFSLDAFAGGMVMNSFLVYWLTSRYAMSESVLGSLFSMSSVITTPSLWAAAWLGNRIGLINTMVFTHLPANCGLVALPFMSDERGVFAVMVFRALLSQMDVPARDAFMMNVVDPEERVACSSFISTMRAISTAIGPLVAAALWDLCGPACPLIVAGVLKCVYDISLLRIFRALDAASASA